MAWNGRQLASAVNGTNSISYSYDENGIRTQKTVNGIATNYNYHGSALISQVTGNDTLLFSYDASGNVAAVNYNGMYYYYVRNGQNDVIRLIDGDNNTVVEYAYDSWGRQISCTGSLASTLGTQNPFWYRGYVYDEEMELYYLQTRYYDAEVGRFISADMYMSTGQGALGHNMYAYCGSNPISNIDPNGAWTLGISLSANLTFILGVSVGVGIYIDDDWNFDIQWSYAVPGVDDTFSTGIADIGGGVALQYTNRDTVYDLYGLASYIGASGGPLWYVGGDVISFLDANNAYSEIDGFQIVGGVGFGFDTHITQANTKKIDLKGLRKKEIKRTPSSNRVSINVK